MAPLAARVVLTAVLTAAAALGHAQSWGDITFISSTVGNNTNRLCLGAPTSMKPSDFGCPATAPYVNADGNVGIGTTNPGQMLTVNGKVMVGVPGQPTLTQDSLAVNSYGPGGIVLSGAPSQSIAGISYGGRLAADSAGNVTISSIYDTASSAMFFKMRTFGTPVNALTILGSGNVGIGTTSPNAKLEVAGTISATGVSVTGVVSATYFVGNGSGLTNLPAASISAGTSGSLVYRTDSGVLTATNTIVINPNLGRIDIARVAAGYGLFLAGTSGEGSLSHDGSNLVVRNAAPGALFFDSFSSGNPATYFRQGAGATVVMKVAPTGVAVGKSDYADPVATLDVSGTVKIAGTGSETCGAGKYGTIRYNSALKAFQICRE